jgi:hypothetical protein
MLSWRHLQLLRLALWLHLPQLQLSASPPGQPQGPEASQIAAALTTPPIKDGSGYHRTRPYHMSAKPDNTIIMAKAIRTNLSPCLTAK